MPQAVTENLDSRCIGLAQSADLRARLRAFAEDWDRPEMGVYDVPYPSFSAHDPIIFTA